MSALAWLREWWSRLIAGAAFATVATVTGVVSYTHIEALTLALHQPLMVARLMPFGVDGLIVVGSVALLQAAPGHERLGWLGVGPGVLASVFANVESGIHHGPLAATWAGVPALSFFLATFMLERWAKAQVGRAGTAGQPNTLATDVPGEAAGPDPCPHQVAGTADEAVVQAFLHSRDCTGEPLSQRQLSASFGLSRPRVAELVGQRAPEPVMNGSAPGA